MLEVLQTFAETLDARARMRERGISCFPERLPWTMSDLFHLRLPSTIGDLNKSWDVWKTVSLLEEILDRDDPVLDLGAYASEVLCSLHRLGFRNLTGIDLNPAVRTMPHGESVRWEQGDMMATRFADGSMAAITSISAIEHGVDLDALFREVSRLLRAGGVFVASTDYWPEKITTDGRRIYGLDWKIFSRAEIESLLTVAASYGLVALGALHFDAREAAIRWGGQAYTFAWLALEKR